VLMDPESESENDEEGGRRRGGGGGAGVTPGITCKKRGTSVFQVAIKDMQLKIKSGF